MSMWKHAPRTISWSALFAGLAFILQMMPISALAAQRDGTVLFFSLEDLTQVLAKPMLPDLSPSFYGRISDGRRLKKARLSTAIVGETDWELMVMLILRLACHCGDTKRRPRFPRLHLFSA